MPTLVLAGLGIGGYKLLNRIGASSSISNTGPNTSVVNTPTTIPKTNVPVTQSTQWATSIVPSGSLIYETHAGGSCDQEGANWANNGYATQSCQRNALIISAKECDCTLGVATLGALPGRNYPLNYVAQVHTEILGGAQSAKFGFKFRQQSVQDTGNGRGGYSFLVDPNGQWQFNRYDADGTRHILSQAQLPSSLAGQHILDLQVSNATFAFFLDGNIIAGEQDATYVTGYFCLVIEPGAAIGFSDLALFSTS